MSSVLDLIDAINDLLNCPQGVDQATMPESGNPDDAPEQVVIEMSVSYVRIKKIKKLIKDVLEDLE